MVAVRLPKEASPALEPSTTRCLVQAQRARHAVEARGRQLLPDSSAVVLVVRSVFVEPRGVPGASGGIRTHDRLITNQVLCQLSYAGANHLACRHLACRHSGARTGVTPPGEVSVTGYGRRPPRQGSGPKKPRLDLAQALEVAPEGLFQRRHGVPAEGLEERAGQFQRHHRLGDHRDRRHGGDIRALVSSFYW